ncbi:MAG: transporter substrate-binding domain-containing protein [Acidiferrobacterales bacterium]|nr:transporter substrate-binding domain-containing protein [Acidiferrobacterales bacterium]
MKKLVRVIFLMGILLAQPAISDTFIIGVEDNQYLPHYSYENGQYIGFGRDVLDAFFEQTEDTIEYQALPVARLFSTFIAGGVDFKYPDNEIWSAKEKSRVNIYYSDPVVDYIDGVSVVPDKMNQPIDDIKIIGTVRGFSAWDWQDRIDSGQLILSENSSTEKLIQQAITGRIHGAYANIDVIQHILKHRFDSNQQLVFDSSLPHTKSNYRLSSQHHPEVIEEFNIWLANNVELIEALKNKHHIRSHSN